jgi:hypothetical protein
MAKAKLAVPLLVALVMGACVSHLSGGNRESKKPSGLLLVGTREGIAAFDTASGAAAWDRSNVLPAPGLSRLFTIKGTAPSPKLLTLDPETGAELAAMNIPSGLTARTASTSGSSVALVEGPVTESPYASYAQRKTRIVVARPGDGGFRSFDLPGNFEPEAFSSDDSKLFLIEHLRGAHLGRYRVRVMRLDSGKVLPVDRLTKFAPDSMRGTGRVHVYSPQGDVLYTLYTRQPPNDAHRDLEDIHNRGMVHAFIHVLNLREGWAHCVDLPVPFGMGSEPAKILAISPDGRFVYAGDGKRMAVVSAQRLRVARVRRAAVFEGHGGEALVGADGRLYFGHGSEVSVVDGRTLEPLGRLPVAGSIRALGISTDGTELFVGDADAVVALDSTSGKQLESIAALGVNRISYLEP